MDLAPLQDAASSSDPTFPTFGWEWTNPLAYFNVIGFVVTILILRKLRGRGFAEFGELFEPARGVAVLIVNFLAVLELTREGMLEVTQSEPYAPIYVKFANAQSE